MEVSYREGIYLPELDLWLDPHQVRDRAFVTHAHADHMKAHQLTYATPATVALMRSRGATRSRFHPLEYGQPLAWKDATVTLYPAGHILGSAQVLVEHRGTRLLYSGDFKLRPGLSCERIEVPQADIVIMETTFGRPRYQFPAAKQVLAELVQWCRTNIEAGFTPVLLCYSLGKGQEVLAGLADLTCPIYLHSAHWRISQVYRDAGVRLPPYLLHQSQDPRPGVVLCAGGCRRTPWYAALGPVRTAYISGWAMDAPWRSNGADAAFTLSDHADYPDLLEYVRLTGANTIYTLHGFDKLFAQDLRRLGYDAEPISVLDDTPGKTRQLALF